MRSNLVRESGDVAKAAKLLEILTTEHVKCTAALPMPRDNVAIAAATPSSPGMPRRVAGTLIDIAGGHGDGE